MAWRVGMLYVCDEPISTIADWHSTSSNHIKKLLRELVEGVYYE